MPKVNPEILTWARERAGLSLAEAADTVGLSAARGQTPLERIRALEAGEVPPTRPLLVRMAKKYRQPLLTFYLERPPRIGNRGQDFRAAVTSDREDEAVLDTMIRRILASQGLIRAALESADEAETVGFIGAHTLTDGRGEVLLSLQRVLQLSRTDLREAGDVDAAFALLRTRAEAAGVFVVLMGNLGSHHTDLDTNTVRGFAAADPVAPLIVINEKDYHAAWSFTLLHEFTHLLLGQTGVSGGEPDLEVERFCNDVASQFLLADDELAAFDVGGDLATLSSRIADFAPPRQVSQSLVAYRLMRLGRLPPDRWRALDRYLYSAWVQSQAARREKRRAKSGGPDYYVVRQHRLGGLVEFASRMLRTGALSTSKAGTVLGVRPQNVGPLIEQYEGRTA